MNSQRSALGTLARLLPAVILLALSLWALAALFFSPLPTWLRLACSAAFVAVAVLCLVLWWRGRALALVVLLAAVAGVGWWWLTMPAISEADWQPDVAQLPSVEFHGDRVRVRNIRDFIYTSEFDYQPRYIDEEYSLSSLRTLDLFLIYWGSPWIAHTILSFGFDDGRYLAVSIEARKQVGQSYSALRSFFRQFTLIYVVATERDVVRLRTNLRHEDVYLYRLQATPQLARDAFLQYAAHINRLAQAPEWYNAIVDNCTTSIRNDIYAYLPDPSFDWRLLVNGRLDEMIYERGRLDQALPFTELKRRSYINPKAQVLPEQADFSAGVRAGLPGFDG